MADRIYSSIGYAIESYELQVFTISLILLDSFGVLFVTLLENDPSLLPSHQFVTTAFLFAKSFVSSTKFVYSAEIIGILISFGFAAITHPGYFIDIMVGIIQFSFDGKYSYLLKLLNLLKLWRMVRFVNSLVNKEKEFHDILSKSMEEKEKKNIELEDEVAALKQEISKEHEARGYLEASLLKYREEVETLNEALSIAAMDIAEVAQTENSVGDEDEDELTEESEGEQAGDAGYEDEFHEASDHLSGATSADTSGLGASPRRSAAARRKGALLISPRSTSKSEAMYSLSLRDAQSDARRRLRAQAQTVVIKPDGSFEVTT